MKTETELDCGVYVRGDYIPPEARTRDYPGHRGYIDLDSIEAVIPRESLERLANLLREQAELDMESAREEAETRRELIDA